MGLCNTVIILMFASWQSSFDFLIRLMGRLEVCTTGFQNGEVGVGGSVDSLGFDHCIISSLERLGVGDLDSV